ncbi:MAG: sporulation protein YqfD [Oscillospiraceae bacterium]
MSVFGISRGMLLGSVEFSGIGGFQERFVSDMMDEGIPLKRVRIANGRISGAVSPLHYYTAAETARSNGVRIRAGKRRGLYFTALRYRRRTGLLIGALLFVMILSIGKITVSDIRIMGDAPEAQVVRILEECGIERGALSRTLDFSLAERRIMLEIEDVAWVDVSLEGCRVTATVRGATPKPKMLDASVPCNIVAARDAMVVEAVVRKGVQVTAVGSGVQKGGLLVSGTVADGGERLLYRHASAQIIGEFTETREFFVPYSETIKVADGEKTEFRYLVIGDDVYKLFTGKAYVEDALYTEQTEKPSWLGAAPIKIRTGIFTKYRSVDVVRSDDDCLKLLKKQRADFEENFYPDYEIVSAAEKCFPEKDGIRLVVDYTLRGDIAEEQEIEVDLLNEKTNMS